jgi:hypothetical protein
MQTEVPAGPTLEQISSSGTVPALVLVALALAVTQILTGLARLRVGRPLCAERPGTRGRQVALATLIVAAMVLIVARQEVWAPPPLLALAGALFLVMTTPGAHDALLCEHGVQRGWHARRYEDLEEWRLTGEHLRFRLHGEWTSVPCPGERQAGVRAKLLELAPERESPFQD